VNLTTITADSSVDQLEDSVEIAHLPDANFDLFNWTAEGATEKVNEDGWTRYCNFILAA
jgi:hypothetical protein